MCMPKYVLLIYDCEQPRIYFVKLKLLDVYSVTIEVTSTVFKKRTLDFIVDTL